MTAAGLPIAVVGAGFSGTLTALHLLARTSRRPILLCERSERFARGTAYGTGDPAHLLNVRASNMSAFPDRPDDFVRWLERTGHHEGPEACVTPAGTFVSRTLYGTYLTSLLSEALSGPEGASRLILVPDAIVDLVPEPGGYRLVRGVGSEIRVAGAVLATGHGAPAEAAAGPLVADPWTAPFAEDLDPTRPVVVIGSGLTMVDVTLHLRHAGFDGPVIAISRRGLLPQSHAATAPWPTPRLTAADRATPSRLLRRLRAEAAAAAEAGVDWRGVVDSLRPVTASLWQSLDKAAQARFLRHARPWWDCHRHRMAVPVGQQMADLVRRGILDIRAGAILGIEAHADGATVRYRPRGESEPRVIEAQRVIRATGASPPDQCDNTLLGRLLDRGLARLDRHGLGLDLDARFALIGAAGRPMPGLWALGPLAVGTLWECTAVPDIRQHAVDVAREAASLCEGGPSAVEAPLAPVPEAVPAG